MLIAQRTLTLASDPPATVPIRLYAPQKGDGKGWFCRFQIDWPHGTVEKEGWGADQVQAIWIALQFIGLNLYHSEYHESGLLYLEKPGSGYGFPVPQNARDMLVGADAEFDG